jgi:hypothetical protein
MPYFIKGLGDIKEGCGAVGFVFKGFMDFVLHTIRNGYEMCKKALGVNPASEQGTRLQSVQTGSGAHRALYPTDTGRDFPRINLPEREADSPKWPESAS